MDDKYAEIRKFPTHEEAGAWINAWGQSRMPIEMPVVDEFNRSLTDAVLYTGYEIVKGKKDDPCDVKARLFSKLHRFRISEESDGSVAVATSPTDLVDQTEVADYIRMYRRQGAKTPFMEKVFQDLQSNLPEQCIAPSN